MLTLSRMLSVDEMVASVQNFRKEKLGINLNPAYPRCPNERTEAGRKIVKNHIKMLTEEHSELIEGITTENIVMIGDAVADLLYVLVGVASDYGLPLSALFTETHIANMKKEHDPTCADGGKPVRKPEGWQPPRIKELLETYGSFRIK